MYFIHVIAVAVLHWITLRARPPLSAPPPTHPAIWKKNTQNFAQTAMVYYNNVSVRQAYISQLHKSFNRTFEKHNSAQNSISYQNLNKYTLYT